MSDDTKNKVDNTAEEVDLEESASSNEPGARYS